MYSQHLDKRNFGYIICTHNKHNSKYLFFRIISKSEKHFVVKYKITKTSLTILKQIHLIYFFLRSASIN